MYTSALYKSVQATGCDAGLTVVHLQASLAGGPLKSEQTLRQMGILHQHGKRNGSLTSNPQHITLKPAGQTKRDRESGDSARHLSRGAGEMVNQARWRAAFPYYFLRCLHHYDSICMFWKIATNADDKRLEDRRERQKWANKHLSPESYWVLIHLSNS